MRYLLDTTFIIDHLRGDSGARVRFSAMLGDGDEAFVNEVVVCEAWTGAHLDGDPDLTALLQVLEFVQPGPENARLAGNWRREARSRGSTLGMADALIAAAANSVGATVLTRNGRDFELTPVRSEDY